jgi:hypothetical protein
MFSIFKLKVRSEPLFASLVSVFDEELEPCAAVSLIGDWCRRRPLYLMLQVLDAVWESL